MLCVVTVATVSTVPMSPVLPLVTIATSHNDMLAHIQDLTLNPSAFWTNLKARRRAPVTLRRAKLTKATDRHVRTPIPPADRTATDSDGERAGAGECYSAGFTGLACPDLYSSSSITAIHSLSWIPKCLTHHMSRSLSLHCFSSHRLDCSFLVDLRRCGSCRLRRLSQSPTPSEAGEERRQEDRGMASPSMLAPLAVDEPGGELDLDASVEDLDADVEDLDDEMEDELEDEEGYEDEEEEGEEEDEE